VNTRAKNLNDREATMSMSPHQGHSRSASVVANDEQTGEVSRRAMLAGAVATTAVAAVGASDVPGYARAADPNAGPEPSWCFRMR
jgi:hypothetical protein